MALRNFNKWWRRLAMLLPLLAASCAAVETNNQGPLQPQSTTGPCEVKRFFVLSQRSVPATMTVANTGQACTVVLFDPNLQLRLNAVLLTGQPSHGLATAELVNGRRQVGVSYTPQPGYAGPDRFSVTWEPGGSGVTVNVTVQAR